MRLCLDSSIVGKKYDKLEEDYQLADELFSKVMKNEFEEVFWSKWLILEVLRVCVKKNFKKQRVDEVRDEIEEFLAMDLVKEKQITDDVINLAKTLIVNLNIYAADAVHLATAILSNSNVLLSEDEHLNKKKVKDFASKFGLEIKRLREFL